jgi:hypothetical protein
MAQSVLAMGAVVAIRHAELCLEKLVARRLRSQAVAYAADYQSQDMHPLLSGVYICYDGLTQPVR